MGSLFDLRISLICCCNWSSSLLMLIPTGSHPVARCSIFAWKRENSRCSQSPRLRNTAPSSCRGEGPAQHRRGVGTCAGHYDSGWRSPEQCSLFICVPAFFIFLLLPLVIHHLHLGEAVVGDVRDCAEELGPRSRHQPRGGHDDVLALLACRSMARSLSTVRRRTSFRA